MLGILTGLNAQTYVCDIDDRMPSSIPGEFTINGQTYPVFYQTDERGYFIKISIYNDLFTTKIVDIINSQLYGMWFQDYNHLYDEPENMLYCTQNLFNTDEYFEYIEKEGSIGYFNHPTTIHVKSTNGNTLWSFNAEEGYGCDCCLWKFTNKYYLVVGEYQQEEPYEHKYHLFFISQTQGLTEVDTPFPISAFPTMPTRDQQITVELGEDANVTEIKVINSIGQELKCIPIEKDQRSVTIPASELGIGLNVLNARNGHSQGSCKIIVK